MIRIHLENLVREELLGSGSLGKIYPYKEGNVTDKWVIKIIKCTNARQLSFAIQEIVLGFRQCHEFINPIVGFAMRKIDEEFHIFIKMPRMKCSLADLIKMHKENSTYFSRDEIIRYFSSLVSALLHLKRQNVCHRDIKPSNILLDMMDTVKLSDIGCAKFIESDYFDDSDSIVGTYNYIAPEIFERHNTKKNWVKADVFSLGITIFELCLISPKFIKPHYSEEEVLEAICDNLNSVKSRYGEEMSDILFYMLRKDPESRIDYEDIEQLLQKLRFKDEEDVNDAFGDAGKCMKSAKKYEKAMIIDWGHAFSKQARYKEAAEKYEKAMIIDPNYKEAYVYWGQALLEQEKYEEAAEKYEKAMIIDPNYKEAYFYWGQALLEQEKYQEAVDKFKRATEIDPSYKEAYLCWGGALFKQGKYEEAVEKYEKATEIDPNYQVAYFCLGQALEEQEKHQEAAENYESAISIDPNYKEAYLRWGGVLFGQKKYEEAAEKYKKAISIDPSYKEAYPYLSQSLLEQEKNQEATNKDERATEIDPKYKKQYLCWGAAMVEQEKYQEDAKQEKPTALEPYFDRLDAFCKQEKAKETAKETAEEHERATMIELNYKEAYFKWGQALLEQEKYEEAAKKPEKATRWNYKETYFRWGERLSNQREDQGTVEKNEKMMRADPIAYFNSEVDAVFEKEKYKEAPNKPQNYPCNSWSWNLKDSQAIQMMQVSSKSKEASSQSMLDNLENLQCQLQGRTPEIKLKESAFNQGLNSFDASEVFFESLQNPVDEQSILPPRLLCSRSWSSVWDSYEQKAVKTQENEQIYYSIKISSFHP